MNKPVFYDGSFATPNLKSTEAVVKNENNVVTDEVRKVISGNPYVFELKK